MAQLKPLGIEASRVVWESRFSNSRRNKGVTPPHPEAPPGKPGSSDVDCIAHRPEGHETELRAPRRDMNGTEPLHR